ncbi:hypothetical protein F2Q68_00000736 [Brassica cretica]|uniref:Replication factor A C-terminal domain-containing protein n=1 Tax=Brassica cretica TaxID=69181 RepID=A0A8S9JFT5_BRACR|nr:hypothetical protein F2Q68_00000736 [Brassica cretica]
MEQLFVWPSFYHCRPHTFQEAIHWVFLNVDKIEFLCTAKKTGVQPYNVWCYIGCSKCSKKLLREISSFTCMFCEKTDAEGCLRYRVELSLSYHANIVSGQVTARDSAPVFKNNGQIN